MSERRSSPPAAHRHPLPARRLVESYALELGGTTRVHVSIGRYPDGRLGEIFVDLHKEGAPLRSAMTAVARLASLALQCGAPVAEVAGMLVGSEAEPRGDVVGHGSVTEALSLVDLVGRVLIAEAGGAF